MNLAMLTELEEFVERFEAARVRDGLSTHPADFVPARSHADYLPIATELVRIDLELTEASQRAARLAEMRRRLPSVFDDADCRSQIALEDFRLRRQAGESVAAADYAREWRIDVASWPARVAQADAPASPQAIRTWTPSLPGELFGDFELLEELGCGAFARVFLARQRELADRLVVLKISATDGAEPRHLAQLQHSNIVPVYSVHRHGDWQGLCMPYLGRSTLADVSRAVRSQGSLPLNGGELISTIRAKRPNDPTWRETTTASPIVIAAASHPAPSSALALSIQRLERGTYVDAVVWLAAKLADGLAHAHDRGILHRDLKPANILLADDCQPLILDFNIAADVTCASSRAALVGGTLPYMSPEQIAAFRDLPVDRGAAPLDARTDLYSLGVVLYELLGRRLPFPERVGSSDRTLDQMLDDRRAAPANLRTLNPRVSADVAAIVAKCLAFDVAQRYQSAHDLAEDLQRQLRNLPLRFAPNTSWRERLAKWGRRHPRLASAGSVATLAAGLAVVASGAWVARERHVERMAAQVQLRELDEELPLVRAGLGVPGLDVASREDAAQRAAAVLERFDLPENAQWRARPSFARLAPDEQLRLEQHCGELLYWLALAKMREAEQAPDETRSEFKRVAAELNERARDCFRGSEPPQALVAQAHWITNEGPLAPVEDVLPAQLDSLDAINQAVARLRRGEYVQVERQLQELVRIQPRDFAAWFWLAHAQWGQGRHVEADASLTVCAALRPEAYLSYFQRGLVRLERKQFEPAADDFERVLELRPELTAALINRGIARQLAGNDRTAVEDFDAALTSGATETRLYFLRSRSRRKLGDLAGAKQDQAEGLARTPTDELSWLARGVARLSRPDDALADFRSALTANPNSIMAMQNISGVLSDYLQRPEESLATLDELVRRQPDRPLWRSSRAVLFARLDRRNAALEDLKAAEQSVGANDFHDDAALVHYQAACVQSLFMTNDEAGKEASTAALRELRRALPLQWSLAATAATDPDLKNLRTLPSFRELLAAAAQFRVPDAGVGAPGAKP